MYTLCLFCCIGLLFTSCGTHDDVADNTETALSTEDIYVTSIPESETPIPEIVPTASSDKSIEEQFIGEYYDCISDEPNLEIKKLEDGTYEVEIGIFRTYHIHPCPAKLVDDKIEFSSTQVEGKTLKGTITLDEYGNGVVRFVSGLWKYLDRDEDYVYYKTSDIPYDKGWEYFN